MSSEQRREDKLRRQLYGAGYRLMKGTPRIADAEPGYQIVDMETNGIVAGMGAANRGFDMSLDEVEGWLREASTSAA